MVNKGKKEDDIYSILKEEHQEVKQKMEKAEKSKDEKLLGEIKKALQAHIKAEERSYYAVLKGFKDMNEIVLEAFEEHLVVKTIIQQMNSVKDKDVIWAKFKVMMENVEHHVQEEEGTMFKESRKNISKEEAVSVGRRFLEEKESY